MREKDTYTLICDLCKKYINEDGGETYIFDRIESKDLCLNCFKNVASEEEQNPLLITDFEIDQWVEGTFGDLTRSRLKDLLTGQYPLDEAKSDVLSFKRYQRK